MCLSIAVNKPDCVLSNGEHEGFQWITVHNGIGYRCGYIRIPVGHPWHGKNYDQIDPDPDVHGGLTFADPDLPCDGDGPDNTWWIGFDCAHSDDHQDPILPSPSVAPSFSQGGSIKSTKYVESECRSLCEQALQTAS